MEKIEIQMPAQKTAAEIEAMHNFYTYEVADGVITKFQFDRQKIAEKLKDMGFFRLDAPDGSCENVRISDNRITLVTPTAVTDAFEDYILNLPDRQIITSMGKDGQEPRSQTITGYFIQNKLYTREIQPFINNILERLRPNEKIEFLTDTKNEKYFFFNNTAIKCTAKGAVAVPYKELEGMIWTANIIDRPYIYTDRVGDFENFCMDICSAQPDRLQSLQSILGYLMHDFYETDLRAAFFTDVNSDDAGANAGRTGKGIIGKALDQMLNRSRTDKIYCCVPAKNLDFSKDTRFGLADQTTKLIHLEDVNKTFDIETLYNDITDGCTIRSQYGTPTVKLLKLMISINRTIELKGSSDRGRLIIFELANYYSDTFRPAQKYGRRFFEKAWPSDEWYSFYSFMVRCENLYLEKGIIEPAEINYSDRRLAESINQNFRWWFEDTISIYTEKHQRVEFEKLALYNQFSFKYSEYASPKYKIAFTKWAKKYCDLKKIPYCEVRSTNDLFILYPTDADFAKARK